MDKSYVLLDGKPVLTVEPVPIGITNTEFERTLAIKSDINGSIAEKIEESDKEYRILFDDLPAKVIGIEGDEIIVKMKNSDYLKLRSKRG